MTDFLRCDWVLGVGLPPKHSRLLGYMDARVWGEASIEHPRHFRYMDVSSDLTAFFRLEAMWGRGELEVGGLTLTGRCRWRSI